MKKLALILLLTFMNLHASKYIEKSSIIYKACIKTNINSIKLNKTNFDTYLEYVYYSNNSSKLYCKKETEQLETKILDYIIYHYTSNPYKKKVIEKKIQSFQKKEKSYFLKKPNDNFNKITFEDAKFYSFIILNTIQFKALKEQHYKVFNHYERGYELTNFNNCIKKNKNILSFSIKSKRKVNDILNNKSKLIINKTCNSSLNDIKTYLNMNKSKIVNNLIQPDLVEDFILDKFRNLNYYILIYSGIKL